LLVGLRTAHIVSTSASFTFPLTSAHRTLVANFAINTYTLDVTASPAAGGSTVAKTPDQPKYDHGTQTATPATGYAFTNWTDGGTIVSTSSVPG
jgi:hypothetical protein